MADIAPQISALHERISDLGTETEQLRAASDKERAAAKLYQDETRNCHLRIGQLQSSEHRQKAVLESLLQEPERFSMQLKMMKNAALRCQDVSHENMRQLQPNAK